MEFLTEPMLTNAKQSCLFNLFVMVSFTSKLFEMLQVVIFHFLKYSASNFKNVSIYQYKAL